MIRIYDANNNIIEQIKIDRMQCSTHVPLQYHLPCNLDDTIAAFFAEFGKPKFPLSSIKLFKIHTSDDFKIEGKLGRNIIRFSMPKKIENDDINKIPNRINFEKCLVNWISSKIQFNIKYEEI